jgi:hypothetical protein
MGTLSALLGLMLADRKSTTDKEMNDKICAWAWKRHLSCISLSEVLLAQTKPTRRLLCTQ